MHMSELCPFSDGVSCPEIVISEEESFRIRLMGYYDVSFMRKDPTGKKTLIFLHGHCVFEKAGMCTISAIKPAACRSAERKLSGSLGEIPEVKEQLSPEIPSMGEPIPHLMRSR